MRGIGLKCEINLCSEECKKDVPVALISFHSCSLDAKIKMNLGWFGTIVFV
jgi:hypothetical protein